ncbi:ABC transporter permease [candidate division WOR-3 bacterium]|nr:ABC transporter permease [candidate division WOR-3 bacterium]
MTFWDLLKLSLATFRTHRMRSFLTALGIIIGVMTVIAIVALIQGMNFEVERQISTLGSNTIYVQKVAWGMGQIDFDELAGRPDLGLADAEALGRLRSLAHVAPQRSRNVNRITHRGEKVTSVGLVGATPAVVHTVNYRVETGRFINTDDSLRKRAVCVVGPYIVDNLFPEVNPVGRKLTIEGRRFTIIGVLEAKGSFLGQSQDNIIIVPLSTFDKYFPEPRSRRERIFGGITIGAVPRPGVTVEQAIDDMRELMRRRHGLGYDKPDDFAINTQDTLRELYQNITRVAFIVMIAVAGISLLVGGIGIMNIMLVAVAERTREIGLRKALGATNRDVLWQFLLEAVLLAVVGGAIGILLGLGIAKLAEALAHLKAAAPFWTILLGFGFSAGVGIFFGIYPASRAARLNPIDALRYE